MYADYEFYTSVYLLGKAPAVPEGAFLYWEREARARIDLYTFGKAKSMPDPPEEVKLCTCAVAEVLYHADSVSQQALEQGGPLSSYSNDGESASFDLSRSEWTPEGKTKKIREIIYRYLAGTGLLYSGI